jgi:hypothetical protein
MSSNQDKRINALIKKLDDHSDFNKMYDIANHDPQLMQCIADLIQARTRKIKAQIEAIRNEQPGGKYGGKHRKTHRRKSHRRKTHRHRK